MFLLLAFSAIALAFTAGYFWKSHALHASRNPSPQTTITPEDRRKALAAIDDAMRAKTEKRMAGRLAAIERARNADPQMPAPDILLAEIAFESGKFDEMRAAAASARAKGGYTADAELLLGVDKWINRSSGNLSSSVANAAVHFTASSDADFAFSQAWFFQGDFLRYAGSENEGRDHILSALHRLNPWDSYDALAAKAILASAEAGNPAMGTPPFLQDTPWTRATTDLAAKWQEGKTPTPKSLTPFGSPNAIRTLAADRMFRVNTASHVEKHSPHVTPSPHP